MDKTRDLNSETDLRHQIPAFLNESKNFIEISGLPRKTNSRVLTSMIVRATNVAPLSTDIFTNTFDEVVGIVEARSETEAIVMINRMKLNPIGRSWRVKLVGDPKNYSEDIEIIKRMMV